MLIISVITIFFLGVIAYQDFTERLISWIFFPIVGTLLVVNQLYQPYISITFSQFYINCALLIFMLFLTTVFYSLKERKIVLIFQKYMGVGDVLAMGLVCVSFSPINMLLCLLGSFMISLVVAIIFKSLRVHSTIPMAGVISILIAIVIITEYGNTYINKANDYAIPSFIINNF